MSEPLGPPAPPPLPRETIYVPEAEGMYFVRTFQDHFNRIDRLFVPKKLEIKKRKLSYVNSRGNRSYLNPAQKCNLGNHKLKGCIGDYCFPTGDLQAELKRFCKPDPAHPAYFRRMTNRSSSRNSHDLHERPRKLYTPPSSKYSEPYNQEMVEVFLDFILDHEPTSMANTLGESEGVPLDV